MQNKIQPEQPQTPQTTETEPDAQAVRHITERLNEITRRAGTAKFWMWMGLTLIGVADLIGACQNLALLVLLVPVNLIALQFIFCELSLNPPTWDAEEMARAGGVKAIPPLFAAFHKDLPMPQKQAICATLALLLPRMKASDAALVTPCDRRTIHAWLTGDFAIDSRYNCPDNLRLAALKALEQVGNARDIPAVERLANRKPQTKTQEIIQQAAIECLPMLRAHCEGVEAARTLLRASQAEEARPDTLLRPASHSAQTNAAELLRGAEPPTTRN